jgi:hypothetical protein
MSLLHSLTPLIRRSFHLNPALLSKQSRQFSQKTYLRSLTHDIARHLEISGYSSTQKFARSDWGRPLRMVGGTAIFYFPFLAIFFGWNIAGAMLLDGHV